MSVVTILLIVGAFCVGFFIIAPEIKDAKWKMVFRITLGVLLIFFLLWQAGVSGWLTSPHPVRGPHGV